jgi:hypothetical protein
MLDRDDYKTFRADHDRLYHVVNKADLECRSSIQQHGLIAGPSRHNWHGLYKPRKGHVYLATAEQLKIRNGWASKDDPYDIFAVDPEFLDRQAITADEDWFVPWSGRDPSNLATAHAINGKTAFQHFRLPVPPNTSLWDLVKDVRLPLLPSFGEWAEAVNLGTSKQTAYSLTCGSIAYNGEIPPTALRLVHSTIPTKEN